MRKDKNGRYHDENGRYVSVAKTEQKVTSRSTKRSTKQTTVYKIDKNGRYHDVKGHYVSTERSTKQTTVYKIDKNGRYHDVKGNYVSIKIVESEREEKVKSTKYYKDKYAEREYEAPKKHGVRTWDTGPIVAQQGGRYAIVVKMKMKGIKPDGVSYHTIIQASPKLTQESYRLIRAEGYNRYNIRGVEIEPVVTIDRKDGTRVDEYGKPTGNKRR